MSGEKNMVEHKSKPGEKPKPWKKNKKNGEKPHAVRTEPEVGPSAGEKGPEKLLKE